MKFYLFIHFMWPRLAFIIFTICKAWKTHSTKSISSPLFFNAGSHSLVALFFSPHTSHTHNVCTYRFVSMTSSLLISFNFDSRTNRVLTVILIQINSINLYFVFWNFP
jgi:hypothetical protein